MSNKAMTWATEQTVGAPNRKLVLLILADYADNDWSCWPSQALIATETELGERTVRRVLGELEADGWIVRTPRYAGGHRTTDLFTLQPNRPDRPVRKPAKRDTSNRPSAAVHTGQALADESLGDPPGEPRSARAPAAAAASLPGLDDPQPVNEPVDGATARSRQAWQLVNAAYDARARKPIENRQHVAKTVGRLLEAGWGPVEIGEALRSAPAWTPTSLQVELGRGGRKPSNRVQSTAADREGPDIVWTKEMIREARRNGR